MGPAVAIDIPVALHRCSGPTVVSPEKLLNAGHFSDLKWDGEFCRKDSNEEFIFNITGEFERYAVCVLPGWFFFQGS